GSEGAGNVRDSLSSFILRCRSAGRSTPSNRFDCSANSVVAAMRSLLASAASASVSSVMYVLFTQSARPDLMLSAIRRFSASSINFAASSAVPLPPDGPGELLVHEDITINPILRRRNRPTQSRRGWRKKFTSNLQEKHD